MNSKTLPVIALLLSLIILSVIAYKFLPLFKPEAEIRLEAQACDPSRAPCSALLPGGERLEFSIAAQPIRPLQPFPMSVSLQGGSAQTVEVDFSGTQMDMGFVRPQLSGDGSRFAGTGTLPVCTTGSMEWQATVLVTAGGRRSAVPFRFVVGAR